MIERDERLSTFDIEVLRVLNGEEVPGMVGGAAMNVTAEFLRKTGYATGTYYISQKGRDYLAALDKGELL